MSPLAALGQQCEKERAGTGHEAATLTFRQPGGQDPDCGRQGYLLRRELNERNAQNPLFVAL